MTTPTDVMEQWKEINANARHWETLVFESAKGYFTVISLALGAAGAAIGWTRIPGHFQRAAIVAFLSGAAVLALLALVALHSQKHFLARLYSRRRELEKANAGLALRSDDANGSGRSLYALQGGFWIAIVLSVSLGIFAAVAEPLPLLKGARLTGANLVGTTITQADLEGACGDTATKLPEGLTLRACQ